MVKSGRNRRRILALLVAVILGGASVYVVATWPYNVVGWVSYRMAGKPFPSRATELRHMKRFLEAKRKLNKKEYDAAFQELQYLRQNVAPTFPFFKEVYLYLGYIHDIRGDLRGEEALHRELEAKDKVFALFLKGLYAIRHGRDAEGREYLAEAVKLDNRLNSLGKYRRIARKVIGTASFLEK